MILLLTSYEPKMGNPGLYSFSYVFLTGTSIKLTTPQLQSRFALIVTTAIVFSIIFIYKHHAKKLNSSIKEKLFENGAFDKKNLWLLTYALGISVIILFGDIFSIRRFMWVGIAFSSLISIYEQTDIKQRLLDRIIGVVAGSILFFILAIVIPPTALGIIGGVSLGLCTTYRFKNIFNCFGALSLAATIYGVPSASILRIENNLLGLILGLIYFVGLNFIFNYIQQRHSITSSDINKN